MKPIAFPQQNRIWAQDQSKYRPLPAYTDEEETISLWSFTWWERIVVLFCGRLWLRQNNYGMPLQPQLPQVSSPFISASTINEG